MAYQNGDNYAPRTDLYNVHVAFQGSDGAENKGPNGKNKVSFQFDKMSGGDVTAKDTKYRPANGTADMVSLGAPRDVNDITITGLMSYDMYTWVPWMDSQTGRAWCTITKQPLDRDGNAYGKALVYKARLTDVKPPDTDSDSSGNSTPALLELMFSAVTPITTS